MRPGRGQWGLPRARWTAMSSGGDDDDLVVGGVGAKAFFMAIDDTHGQELWVTDGTSGGTFHGRGRRGPGLAGGSVSRTAAAIVLGLFRLPPRGRARARSC